MTEQRTVTIEDWRAEGAALFGEDPKLWELRCPSCGHAQSLSDYINANVNPEDAQAMFGFSCIGRMRTNGNVVSMFEDDLGHGCDYAGGGLFRINPVTVTFDDEYGTLTSHTIFEWAYPDE